MSDKTLDDLVGRLKKRRSKTILTSRGWEEDSSGEPRLFAKRRQLVRVSKDPGRAGMYQYGPKGRNGASVWISGPSGGIWWATIKFRSQEKDINARSLDEVLSAATAWIENAPELRR